MNRFFAAVGYTNINANQKTHCEDAYGVEQQFRNYKGENRNMLTTDATARMMAEIITGRIASAERTKIMADLLRRDPFKPSNDPDDQATGFAGKALLDLGIREGKYWGKAGWTSRSRHDAAFFELPNGSKFVLAVFTEGHAADRGFIASIAAEIIKKMGEK
jgi:hypothetical protein